MFPVRDTVNAAADVIGDVQRAVTPFRESDRTMLRRAGLQCRRLQFSETIGKRFVVATARAIADRLKHNAITGLWFGRAIPRAVERNEETVAIFLGELVAPINQQ